LTSAAPPPVAHDLSVDGDGECPPPYSCPYPYPFAWDGDRAPGDIGFSGDPEDLYVTGKCSVARFGVVGEVDRASLPGMGGTGG